MKKLIGFVKGFIFGVGITSIMIILFEWMGIIEFSTGK